MLFFVGLTGREEFSMGGEGVRGNLCTGEAGSRRLKINFSMCRASHD